MAIGIGACYRGRITRIAPFGAFAALEGTDGEQNGMIHISELSPGYVRQVSDLVSVGDSVTVKVLRIDERGRIALSRRQAMTEDEAAEERKRLSADRKKTADMPPPKDTRCHTAEDTAEDFEEMLRRFRAASEETLTVLRRSAHGRRTRRKR